MIILLHLIILFRFMIFLEPETFTKTQRFHGEEIDNVETILQCQVLQDLGYFKSEEEVQIWKIRPEKKFTRVKIISTLKIR